MSTQEHTIAVAENKTVSLAELLQNNEQVERLQKQAIDLLAMLTQSNAVSIHNLEKAIGIVRMHLIARGN